VGLILANSTISDVAEKAGVSKSTVSHVLNKTRFVEPETAERVQLAMRELHYRPNSLARSLRRQETRTIGLLMPDNLNAFWAELSQAVVRAGYAEGYTVLLGNSDWSVQHQHEYIEAMIAKQLDGIILAQTSTTMDSMDAFEEILRAEVPVVAVNSLFGRASVSVAMVDEHRGGYLAGQYLAQLGHRKVGCISVPVEIEALGRVDGFREALAEVGVPLPETSIVHGDYEFASGATCVQELLARDPGMTAVFAINDNMAMGAMKGLQKMGRRVPEDVSVIGFDNIVYAAITSPGLTTIAQPITAIGQTAFRLLQRCMQDSACAPEVMLLEPSLVVRESCRAL
jgi:LacI family transcriptional regulator